MSSGISGRLQNMVTFWPRGLIDQGKGNFLFGIILCSTVKEKRRQGWEIALTLFCSFALCIFAQNGSF